MTSFNKLIYKMISLITATYGRINEIRILLDSLTKQHFKDFEIVLVDQNEHFNLKNLIEEYNSLLNIKYIRSDVKGLSYNRNIGMSYASGDIIGFPDDDCYYGPDVLQKIVETFENQKIKLVATAVKDTKTDKVWKTANKIYISRYDTLKYCFSNNFFIRRSQVRFDTRLGVGAHWGACEESDFIWEILNKSDYGVFLNNTYIYHPYFMNTAHNLQKSYSYGLGFGALFKKEIVLRKNKLALITYLYYIIRSLGSIILKKNKRYYYYTLKGRLYGFFSFKV